MRFAIFDHNDTSGRSPATQLAERLILAETLRSAELFATEVMPAFT